VTSAPRTGAGCPSAVAERTAPRADRSEAARIDEGHRARRALGDGDGDRLGIWVVAELVPEEAAEDRRCVRNGYRLATREPMGRNPGCHVEVRGAVFIGFEQQDVPEQQHQLGSRPAVRDVAHVPPAVGDTGEVGGNGIAVLLVPGTLHHVPLIGRAVEAADSGVGRVAHRPSEALVHALRVAEQEEGVR
jgi:hypothetical protein